MTLLKTWFTTFVNKALCLKQTQYISYVSVANAVINGKKLLAKVSQARAKSQPFFVRLIA
ncbi:MAG: hypothetical protein MJK12_02550 [Colwellia sp.]|nr:hypothetical protein [Colwellia sp.]